VGSYYTVEQVNSALAYYFTHEVDHSLWRFISEIDKLYERSIKEEQLHENLQLLIEQTKDRMKDFEQRTVIDNEGS